jgi:non-specific serine/threonine protein kinase
VSSFALSLTPRVHLIPCAPAADAPALDGAVERRLRAAFEAGTGAGLLQLGAAEVTTALPPPLGFWRDFGRGFVAAACATPALEEVREKIEPPVPPDELLRLVQSAPPMEGGEYLSLAALESLWGELLAAFREALQNTKSPVQDWLAARHPAWNVVGRVHLHLAENKRDPERPFAFLATFTTSLSGQGKPRHSPLGEAVRASSSARDDQRLLALLSPVQRAASKSPLLAELVSS